MNQNIKKMKLKAKKKYKLSRKAEQPLKLWFFIVHPGKPYIKNEAVLAIIGYNLEEALVKANLVAKGLPATYTGQNALVKDFVNRLFLDGATALTIKEPKIVKPLSKKKLAKEEFKAGLLLTLNEPKEWDMKISKKDKDLLKIIIEKL